LDAVNFVIKASDDVRAWGTVSRSIRQQGY